MAVRDVHWSEDEPHDELSQFCDVMIKAAETHPLHDDDTVKIIVSVTIGDKTALGASGYPNNQGVVWQLINHAEAVGQTCDMHLNVVPISRN